MTSFLLNVVNKTIYIKIKNIMKKLINFLTITLIAFIIVSCCSQKKVTNTAGVYGLSLKYDLPLPDSPVILIILSDVNCLINGSLSTNRLINKSDFISYK